MATDGSAGAIRTLDGPDYDIGADLGTQAGDNLFHSFERFSIGTGESATFSGPDSVDNIISRVTGGELSSIDGLLASTIPGASLWLFNPAGVVFGPNASLDVSGSFHVSTADELRFSDGGRFSVVDPNGNGFSVAAPESFGFLGADPAGITIDGSSLEVGEGETLSVVGGDVDIAGGVLVTGGGELNVLAAAGPADVNGITGELTGDAGGDIDIAGSTLASIGDGGGTIRIQGGAFVADQSTIFSTNDGPTDGDIAIDVDVETAEISGGTRVITETTADGRGGAIDIAADNLLITDDGALESFALASGQGGDIDLAGGDIVLQQGGFVLSDAQADGDGGDIGLAGDIVAIRSVRPVLSSASASGDGGDIEIAGDAVVIRDGGAVSTLALAGGDGGDIGISAGDLELTNGDVIAGTGDAASGDGGNIVVAADLLELQATGPGELSSIATTTFGSGDGGDVDIRATDVLLDGGGELLGASIQALSSGQDSRAGQIQVTAGSLALLSGGIIFGEAGSGAAGDASIDISADTIRIDGAGARLTGISFDGNAPRSTSGAITVSARELDIQNGGTIDSSSGNDDDAGDIFIAVDRLSLGGRGDFSSTKISSNSSVDGAGSAGRITIVADVVELSGDANVSSAAFGEGDAGIIDILARSGLRLEDDSKINTNSFLSTGAAGSIAIRTTDLTVLDGSQIISATFGSGNAGSISIIADNALFDGRGAASFNGITTQAGIGSVGDAGSIGLKIDNLILRNKAQISSASFGAGSAGDISLQSGDVTIEDRGGGRRITTGIVTSVEPGSSGEGGNITIIADRLTLSGDAADITASNDGAGIAGTVDIRLTKDLVLDDGADIFTSSASAGGGGITIAAGRSVTAAGSGSIISTTVGDDAGNAGDIVITTPLLALGDARVLARADAGEGGDIDVSTDDLILSPLAEINAQAGATGVDGTVAVSAAEVDLTGGLTALDGRFLNVTSLLRERCAAKRAEDSSSFTLGTGGAVAADLDAPRLSLLSAEIESGLVDRRDRRTVLVLPCPNTAP